MNADNPPFAAAAEKESFPQWQRRAILETSPGSVINLTYFAIKFDVCLFETKNKVFEFDYQKLNTFESVQRSELVTLFPRAIIRFSTLIERFEAIQKFSAAR